MRERRRSSSCGAWARPGARDRPARSGKATPSALADFATERLAKPDHQLPAGQSFAEWFRSNEPALRENAALRDKNVIIARQMLPLFEATPAGWGAVPYLNLGKRQKHKPLAQYFAEWQAASPAEVRPFLARLAALFLAAEVFRPR